jgi:hypothetical protein
MEAAKKKTEVKVEQLEQKVCGVALVRKGLDHTVIGIDGGYDTRKNSAEGKRAECNL